MLSAVTTSLLVCVVKLFIWYVAVCCLCLCVPDVLVCGMFGCFSRNIDFTVGSKIVSMFVLTLIPCFFFISCSNP